MSINVANGLSPGSAIKSLGIPTVIRSELESLKTYQLSSSIDSISTAVVLSYTIPSTDLYGFDSIINSHVTEGVSNSGVLFSIGFVTICSSLNSIPNVMSRTEMQQMIRCCIATGPPQSTTQFSSQLGSRYYTTGTAGGTKYNYGDHSPLLLCQGTIIALCYGAYSSSITTPVTLSFLTGSNTYLEVYKYNATF